MSENEEPLHPIGVVAERTGLSPDVLRVWQRRYGVVDPGRARGGRRLYTESDLERLGLLARATSAGRGISQVAHLGVAELRRLVEGDEQARRVREETSPGREHVDAATRAIEVMDAVALEQGLRRALALLGALPFLVQGVLPVCRGIGEAWHEGRLSVAQEHAATAVALRVVGSMRTTAVSRPNAPVLVVGTPEGDHHELGAMLVAVAAELEEWRVVYLGANVPVPELVQTAVSFGARAVALSVSYVANDGARADVLCALRAELPAHIGVLAGGSGSAFATLCEGVTMLPDPAALRHWLRTSGR
ncbi:MAG: MerR family transcriptional regulator [Gemmatimonadetes bacterium]|nr:MerR family transcriptional regulator [Gemmatimonadota bacterium]